ncbi:MAG: amino acid-binding protein [Acidobacteria bacterium]|nr:MAG: amino acid-binding protein [Acidobacteriota bacterium]
MKDFAVRLTHRPGELARVANMLSRYGVNLKSVAALAIDGQASVHILPDDAEPARAALEKNGIPFEESEVVTVLLENRAGELASLSGKLSEAGVNVRAIYVTGVVDNLVELAVVSDNVERARAALE